MTVRRFYMTVGLPGTGKTTYFENTRVFQAARATYLSSDMFIEEYAATLGETYNEVFRDYAETAQTKFFDELDHAIKRGDQLIYCDRTALSIKSRERVLKRVSDIYLKYAILFFPDQNWNRYLQRPGKSIPSDILAKMALSFQFPKLTEGFQSISIVIDGKLHQAVDWFSL